MSKTSLDTVPEALEDLKKGKVIIVVDDEDRENEGDFLAVAEKVTPEMVNFMTIHGRGLICTPVTEQRCKELDLYPMVSNNTDPKETAFTVSIDLLGQGVTTGISAWDRYMTIKSLIEEDTTPRDLSRPGHIFPLKAKEGGVLRRPGHTEAAVDLAKLSGHKPAGIIVEIMNEDGSMARLPQLLEMAEKFDLKIISIEDLIAYRLQYDSLIQKIDAEKINTFYGEFELITYKQTTNDQVHFALKLGEWEEKDEVLVRVQSSSAYSEFFMSLITGENPPLDKIAELVTKEGKGLIVFINNAKTPSQVISEVNKFKSILSGKQVSKTLTNPRDYGIGAQIIKDLGISKMKLITRSEPKKKIALQGYGLEIVDTVSILG